MNDIARLTLDAKTLETADAKIKPALENAQKAMGFVPNMYANMANSPGMLETYLKGYELFRKDSGFTSAEQEVVLLAISRFNGCTYCMAAHSMIAEKMSKVPAESLKALRDGKPLADAKLEALSSFTREMVSTRGRPSKQATAVFLSAGFSERQVLEVVLAIAVKTISNYSNHLFDTNTDAAFAGYAWSDSVAATA